MDISTYESLTGKTVPASKESFYNAMITRSKVILENILGYSLDLQDSSTTRYFIYNERDQYIKLDPFISITSIKLVNDDTDEIIFDAEDYRIHHEANITRFIQLEKDYYREGSLIYKNVQLKVDAEWEWTELPIELKLLWADMITYATDEKKDIKSETLGTHSYTKTNIHPELREENQIIIKKYQGGNANGIIIPII